MSSWMRCLLHRSRDPHAFDGMPNGKAKGERCVHLDENWLCGLFGDPRRPACCSQFQAEVAFCGSSREEALQLLTELEVLSDPKGA